MNTKLTNKKFREAHYNMNDEYLSTEDTVIAELASGKYNKYFNNAVIYLPCHKMSEAAFENDLFKYFYENKESIKWKKLIHSIFIGDGQYSINEYYFNGEITQTIEEYELIDGFDDGLLCVPDMLNKSDIVVANPRGTKFADFWDLVMVSGKKFIMWGIMMKMINKNLTKDLMNGLWHYGETYNKPMEHWVGDTHELKKMNTTSVFTNCDIELKRKLFTPNKTTEELISKGKMRKFDNINMYNVDKYYNIPCDFKGKFACPISSVGKLDPAKWRFCGIINSFGEANEAEGRYCGDECLIIKNGAMTRTRIGVIDGKAKFTRAVIEKIA